MNAITSFQGEYRFLSNFWPCLIVWEGVIYPTLEHAYAASKTNDPLIKTQIQLCSTPGEAKEYLAAHGVRPDTSWTSERKLEIMEALLRIKFSGNNPLLTRALLATADAALVEGNDWNDRFWGVCDGAGENYLGKLLMKVRAGLFEEKTFLEKYESTTDSHRELADRTGITPLQLYEKMIAFGLSQRKFLGY
jgi:ribA/ribD-fused uncharacterized protein